MGIPMHPMRGIAAIVLALAGTVAAGPSFAFPHINTISSETVSTSPIRVKTTFTVELVGYDPGAAYWGINDYVVTGCLVIDAPTPAGASSWGRIKAAYR